MSIKLVIDSTADLLPSDFGCDVDVDILPVNVSFDGIEYTPNVNLTNEKFYEYLSKCTSLPKTTQVSIAAMEDSFRRGLETHDEIVGIFLAEKLSGTFNSARLAKLEVGSDKIHIIDSRTVTFPLSALVLEAYRLIKEGKMNGKEIASYIESLTTRIKILAVVDDLTYLKMGGRISGATANLANFFNFKPLIAIEDGVIESVGKERGLNNAFKRICKTINKKEIDLSLPCYLGHSNDEAKAKILGELLVKETSLRPEKTILIGASVGTHAGPGAAGIAFFVKEKTNL